MIDAAKRYAAAILMTATRVPQRARRQLYGGRRGVRIVTFHDVPTHQFDRFRRVVDKCLAEFDLVGPEVADDLVHGRTNCGSRDKLLITFDDGFISNYQAAQYLASHRVRAIFFVVPSFLNRSMQEFLDFHASRGIQAYRFTSSGEPRGLSTTQVREMAAMGHQIAGHNFAHRDLGQLTTSADLEYEVDRAVDAVAEIIGGPCHHFAFGFGRPRNISAQACEHLQRRCPYVYSCMRGLNVTGITPRLLLRDGITLEYPFLFNWLCVRGGGDLHWVAEVAQLKQLGGVIPASNAAI